MPPSASLIIPFEAGNPRKARTLQEDVQQIVKQKGAFRHVNEEKLLADSARLTDPGDGDGDGDGDQSDHSTDTEPETVQDTQKRLFTTRNELIRLYQTSLNEINTLLDLVSWLLSARSKVAQTTMSPALKGGVPVGSAEVKSVPPPNSSSNVQQRLDGISNIVRLQAFEKCKDKLSAASSRLEIEAQHQSKYWDQMAQLRSKGWPVSRLPRDGRSLVAHVASTEAAPRYKNKGLVPFRRDENGDLTVPSMQGSGKQRCLTVSVRRGDEITGFYQGRKGLPQDQSSLEKVLVQAKEMIFEEELFSEASREAQLIANMGAKVRSNSIEMEISPECSISIAYLSQSLEHSERSHEDDDIAAYVVNGLRTMLIAEYESKYRTRSQRPSPPVTLNPRPSPEYVLVRPLIAQMRHSVNAFPLLEDLRTYEASLAAAGLPISVDIGTNGKDDSSGLNLQTLRQITTSNIKMKLSSGTAVEFNIETQLAPPRFGTQFSSTEYTSECGSRGLQYSSSTKAAAFFLADVIARDVCCAILHFKHDKAQWRVQASQPLELVLVKDDKPCVVLAASCRGGSFAVSHLQITAGIKERIVYDRTGSTLIRRNGQREETKMSIREVIDIWVAEALRLTE